MMYDVELASTRDNCKREPIFGQLLAKRLDNSLDFSHRSICSFSRVVEDV